MGSRVRVAAVALWLAALGLGVAAAVARAQGTEGAPADAARQQPPTDTQVDVFDALRRLFKGPPANPPDQDAPDDRRLQLSIMPGFGYNPSAGFVVGASGSLSDYFGDPATTRISSAVIGVSYSTKHQASLTMKFGASSGNNRWRLDGDNRFQWTSQDSYGLGTGTSPADSVYTRFTFVRITDGLWYELTKNWYAGAGFHYSLHTNVRPGTEGDPAWEDSAYVVYSAQNGFNLEGQTSAGLSLGLMLDTRDNPINASRGWFATVGYRPSVKGLFGADAAFQGTFMDVRSFVSVTKDRRHRLAAWVHGEFAGSGTAPYFDLPALGVSILGRSGRGYTEGRFRGDQLLYGELEYRATLTRNGLLGVVAFVNTTTLADRETGEQLFDGFATAGGVGLRVLFNKRTGTNMCVDYAWGRQGAKGLYLGIQEAF
jgi:outer membrane protein assembly factor BamA